MLTERTAHLERLAEVDLLDPLGHNNPQAYRRDRRKDMLLQENGYMVLRFLASDVGTHLDDVLDAIVRALVKRQP